MEVNSGKSLKTELSTLQFTIDSAPCALQGEELPNQRLLKMQDDFACSSNLFSSDDSPTKPPFGTTLSLHRPRGLPRLHNLYELIRCQDLLYVDCRYIPIFFFSSPHSAPPFLRFLGDLASFGNTGEGNEEF